MRKFQSFDYVSNYLCTEEVPFEDNKRNIIDNIETKVKNSKFANRKLAIISITLILLTIFVAFTYGYIKEHEIFVELHKGEIIGKLTDDKGNIVIQLGIMTDRQRSNEIKSHMEQSDSITRKFSYSSKTLEDKLPDDKVALFIPVKGLESPMNIQTLNSHEYYYSLEDIKEHIPNNSPLPGYIPEGLELTEATIFYEHDFIYSNSDSKTIDNKTIKELFEQARNEGKEYYYKEFERYKEVECYKIKYKITESEDMRQNRFPWLYLWLRKGKTTSLYDGGTADLYTEVIEHNGKKYLKEINKRIYGVSYYTYVYIDDELWTISIETSLSDEEVFKIVEELEY